MKAFVSTLSLLLIPSVAAQLPTYYPTIWEDSASIQDDDLVSITTENGTSTDPTYAPGPSWDDDSSGKDNGSSLFSGNTSTPVPSPYIGDATPMPSSGTDSSPSGPYDDSLSSATSPPTVDAYATSSNTAFPTLYPETASETSQAAPSSYVTVEEISSFPTSGDWDDWAEYSTNATTMSGSGDRGSVVAAAETAEGYGNGAAARGAFWFLGLPTVVSLVINLN
ncbi:hypothetical protein HJC23_002957 [Cyclotella cryptica]|uniref:Uncharacterized protein n=1 Tax=Cyclotella cryptica TaxID=29204 RepID=A0ABD3PE44_9STRA